jgi:hypothetical protein
MHGDRGLGTDDEQDDGLKYDEEDQSLPTPPGDGIVSPHGGHGQHQQTRAIDPDYSLPMRFIPNLEEARAYQDTTMHNAPMQQQPYMSNGFQQQNGVQEQDPSRRTAWTQGFSSPQNQYSTWTSPGSNMVATTSIGYGGFTSVLPPPNASYLPPPSGSQQMRLVHPQPFGNEMNRGFDSGNALRSGNLGHAHGLPQHNTYHDYLHDSNFAGDSSMKEEHHLQA